MRRALLCVVILAVQFAVLEGAIRLHGGSEVAPEFRRCSCRIRGSGTGWRRTPARAYTTVEFSTDLAINAQGVRDDEPIGPKAPNERRVVVLGDSLVLSVQVPFAADVLRAARSEAERAPTPGTAGA